VDIPARIGAAMTVEEGYTKDRPGRMTKGRSNQKRDNNLMRSKMETSSGPRKPDEEKSP